MKTAIDITNAWLDVFEPFVLTYFLILNTSYLFLTIIAATSFSKYFRRLSFSGLDDVFANPFTPSVSIIVPAHNEEVGIVDSIKAMLALRFPDFEIVVVDDGSTDETFSKLRDEFDLVEIPKGGGGPIPNRGPVESLHIARNDQNLLVVRKQTVSSRSDALNAGLNYARKDLCCMIDADSLLEPESLLRVVKPFVDDPDHVVGCGGVIRPANGCTVDRGSIVSYRMPKSIFGCIQTNEYLRSFLIGRSGWSALNCLCAISGAFGIFPRELLWELKGLDPYCIGEDMELVMRIHRHYREQGRRDYRIMFISEPVCWTEVPPTMATLRSQRRRWSRGLGELLWTHRRMMFNPRYGRIGLIGFPYYVFFELLTPFVELAGVATMLAILGLWVAGQLLGQNVQLLNINFAILFFIVALAYGMLLSLAALVIEELSFHRMTRWSDLARSFVGAIVENVGFRQMHAWWRLKGLIWWLCNGKPIWDTLQREGFAAAEDVQAVP